MTTHYHMKNCKSQISINTIEIADIINKLKDIDASKHTKNII